MVKQNIVQQAHWWKKYEKTVKHRAGFKELAELIPINYLTSRVIRSHLILENLLNCLLEESLNTSHRLEIKKLSFSFKVDLCYALIPPLHGEIKPLLAKINQIRNQFAHNHKAVFGNKEATDLLNTAPGDLKNNLNCFKNIQAPLEIWHACIYSCFIVLNIGFGNLVKYQVSQEVYNSEIDELLKEMKPFVRKLKRSKSRNSKAASNKIKKGVHQRFSKYQS